MLYANERESKKEGGREEERERKRKRERERERQKEKKGKRERERKRKREREREIKGEKTERKTQGKYVSSKRKSD